jgi:hypothetical protein
LNRKADGGDGWGQGMIMGTGGGMGETKRVGFVNDVMPEHQMQNTEDEFRQGSHTLVRTRDRGWRIEGG